jgi:hypothetical protein
MPPFMLEIEAAQQSPLDQLAYDYLTIRSGQPSLDFCCRALGVDDDDTVVARRLGVAISTVRGWRAVGRRANGRAWRQAWR